HHRRTSRRTAIDRLLHRHRVVDHLEGQLGGLAEYVLQPLRVLQAGHLYDDAVVALTLDHRLGGAELVDALADDLDRLSHRRVDTIIQTFVGERISQEAGFRLLQRQLVHGRRAENAGRHRSNEVSKRRLGLLDVGSVGDAYLDVAVTAVQSRILDPG